MTDESAHQAGNSSAFNLRSVCLQKSFRFFLNRTRVLPDLAWVDFEVDVHFIGQCLLVAGKADPTTEKTNANCKHDQK
jgi:hypothetical protein